MKRADCPRPWACSPAILNAFPNIYLRPSWNLENFRRYQTSIYCKIGVIYYGLGTIPLCGRILIMDVAHCWRNAHKSRWKCCANTQMRRYRISHSRISIIGGSAPFNISICFNKWVVLLKGCTIYNIIGVYVFVWDLIDVGMCCIVIRCCDVCKFLEMI